MTSPTKSLLGYGVRKIALLVASLFIASLVIFATLEVIPGDPVQFMLGVGATPETIAALRAELNLDLSPTERYLSWIGGMVQGDFGISYRYRVPAAEIILERLTLSIPLALMAIGFVVVIAPILALTASLYRYSRVDKSISVLTQLGIAVPNFWVAILLIHIFALQLALAPAGGFSGWEEGITQGLYDLLLPSFALAIPQIAILARIMRGALEEVLDQDYIRTAKAKGLSPSQILMRHALRNAMMPTLTIVGMQFSFLLAGTIIIENIFALPGLGRLIFQSIAARDLIMVESVVLLLVFATLLVNLIVDIVYVLVDPRLRRPS